MRKLHRNPFTICKNFQRSGRSSTQPPWFTAVQKVPPPPMPLRSVVPSEVAQFAEPDAQKQVSELQAATTRLVARVNNPRKAYRPHYVRKPPRIVYPEDKLREEFYRTHPFELVRPRNIVETEESLKERTWSSIDGGEGKTELTGENVIKYTTYLMSKEGGGLSRAAAYRQALSEFYKRRAEEEHREELEKQQLAAAKAREEEGLLKESEEEDMDYRMKRSPPLITYPARPWTEKFAIWEQLEMNDSLQYRQDILKQ
ncbi:mitochondrial ribosomal small subunit component [Quaeritorhiza haematococci]|nr:mitochondrial ribosomal small subunit component [Quaeritorhiza haematococci]